MRLARVLAALPLVLIAQASPIAPQILPPDRIARYKSKLPRVAWKKLEDVFESPSTLWYDEESMIPSYQDSVGDGSFTPIGARANSTGRDVIVPEGLRLFDEDGEHWSFPFGHTAGTDRARNKLIVNFLWLPSENGAFWPVVYRTIDDNSALGGLGLHKWIWMFPKGTLIGEVIFIKDAGGEIFPAEVRTRQRWIDGWSVNAHRPFPTAERMVEAIERARPNWASQPNLRAFVEHLQNPNTLVARSLRSSDFNDLVTLEGFIDVLPDLGNDALVKELLTGTTFVSAYGLSWKTNGSQTTFAASTNELFSFVPEQYDAGLLEVREESCTRCHRDAGRPIEDFEPAAILYGDIWGEDQIFSFHPWNQDRYVIFNTENRAVRPEFAESGYVVRYDPARHPAHVYRELER